MPDRPLTPNEIAAHLAELARQLDDLVSQVDTAERDAVNKREDYTAAYASAFLSASGAMDIRRHHATLDTTAQRVAAELAEQHVKGLRRRIDSIKIRIDVGRSLGAAMRAEIALTANDRRP